MAEFGLRNVVYRRPLATALDRIGIDLGWRCADVGAGAALVPAAERQRYVAHPPEHRAEGIQQEQPRFQIHARPHRQLPALEQRQGVRAGRMRG